MAARHWGAGMCDDLELGLLVPAENVGAATERLPAYARQGTG